MLGYMIQHLTTLNFNILEQLVLFVKTTSFLKTIHLLKVLLEIIISSIPVAQTVAIKQF
jgi:hypothetical protein